MFWSFIYLYMYIYMYIASLLSGKMCVCPQFGRLKPCDKSLSTFHGTEHRTSSGDEIKRAWTQCQLIATPTVQPFEDQSALLISLYFAMSECYHTDCGERLYIFNWMKVWFFPGRYRDFCVVGLFITKTISDDCFWAENYKSLITKSACSITVSYCYCW